MCMVRKNRLRRICTLTRLMSFLGDGLISGTMPDKTPSGSLGSTRVVSLCYDAPGCTAWDETASALRIGAVLVSELRQHEALLEWDDEVPDDVEGDKPEQEDPVVQEEREPRGAERDERGIEGVADPAIGALNTKAATALADGKRLKGPPNASDRREGRASKHGVPKRRR